MDIPEHDREHIAIRGARQNNLKNLSLDVPLNELVVVTGVSGSGKSSLVFDTLYAEGQRRYVETFSPYARQFLDRQDRPQVDSIDGIPPAIAIDQVNPVRTSRSTVGTMTELNDHLKLLFARASHLHCKGCGAKVTLDTPQSIFDALQARAKAEGDPRVAIAFPVPVPTNFKAEEVKALLGAQGYTRFLNEDKTGFEVVQDRLRMGNAERGRVVEALEAALKVGQGRINVHVLAADDANASSGTVWKYSADLHCAECDIHYAEPNPSLFSFNSPMGACDTCRGFGRVIGLDFGLVVPDESKSLRDGAVKPWQTPSNKECQDDLMKYARLRGIPVDKPWRELSEKEKRWVLDGEPEWEGWRKSWPGTWYGVARFFKWLETKSYKMHVRVLLSKYRAYTECTTCGGARLKTDALLWRIGTSENAEAALGQGEHRRSRYKPHGVQFSDQQLQKLPGLTVHDVMLLPLERTKTLFDALTLPAPLDEATDMLLGEIRTRLAYLNQVGLGYLTLDRQSRTLSGGEVQRINLTTALGTSLVNTLFVLDEPSIGLHPRDMGRVIGVMHKLRDAGNSLVVVEHDPQVMLAADRLLDIGPGPGSRGGEIVAFDTPARLMDSKTSVTGRYLAGELHASERRIVKAPAPKSPHIRIRGASEHNLKNVDADFPLDRLVCVTGVSGSGKSTLVQDVLYAALRKALGQPTEAPGKHDSIYGVDQISDVVMVDQSSIGRTTRSNPASYVGAFDTIRSRYSSAPLAQSRGYTAGTFSFNSGTGRCPTCSGNGFEHVEMQFLSDVYLRCPDCDGRRYRAEVLEITIGGKSIADVLELTIADALAFFNHAPDIARALQPLVDVGLDYLKLGQPVPTLSGGEAQRLKLAGFLAEAANSGRNALGGKGKLFLFDEPTTGLHFDDIRKLLDAFQRLIHNGGSILLIEHNLEVIRAADWVIDLGPEGGGGGGRIVGAGTPEEIAKLEDSHTGRFLREMLGSA
jgi:excinuclease ABC subunit A